MQKNLIGKILLIIVIAGIVAYISMQKTQPSMTNTETNSSMLSNTNAVSVKTEEVSYYAGVKGYYAHPETEGNYPGVVMIHEWWGLNDNVKTMARQLASEGYQVLAVDLYNGTVATTPDEAMKQVQSVNQEEMKKNMQAAVDYMRRNGASRIASLGWCFGGGQSLALALSGEQLDGTILYYGTPLITDTEKLKAIDWPVLGIFGDKDAAIPIDSIHTFDQNLQAAGVEHSVVMYPGLGHAFANPSGQNYAATETKDAWSKTLAFLKQNLSQ
jgi:carboxymethylenebutenolidase